MLAVAMASVFQRQASCFGVLFLSKSEFPVEPDRESGRAGNFGSAHEVLECLRCCVFVVLLIFFFHFMSFVSYPAVRLQSWSLPQGVSRLWGMSHDVCGARRQWRSSGGVCHSSGRPFTGKIFTTTKIFHFILGCCWSYTKMVLGYFPDVLKCGEVQYDWLTLHNLQEP